MTLWELILRSVRVYLIAKPTKFGRLLCVAVHPLLLVREARAAPMKMLHCVPCDKETSFLMR